MRKSNSEQKLPQAVGNNIFANSNDKTVCLPLAKKQKQNYLAHTFNNTNIKDANLHRITCTSNIKSN